MTQTVLTREVEDDAEGGAPRAMPVMLATTAVFLAAVVFSIALTRDDVAVAAFWPANGILCIGLLLLHDNRIRAVLLAVCGVGNVLLNTYFGDPLGKGVIFACLNVSEALIAFAMVKAFDLRGALQANAWRLVPLTLTIAFTAPIVPAVAGAGVLALTYGLPFGPTLLNWFVSNALGLTLTVPVLLLFYGPREVGAFDYSKLEVVGHFALLMGFTVYVFVQYQYPFLFVVFPILTLIAFRLGSAFSALAALVVSVIAVAATLAGSGPIALMAGSAWLTKVHVLQIFIIFVFLTTLPIASMLDERARLLVRLAARDKEMQAAMELAQAAVRAKGEFLSNMSHELRTPLNSIAGFTQLLLKRSDLDDGVRGDINKIRTASTTLITIVDDILDYTKLEEGRMETVVSPFALTRPIDNATAMVATIAEQRGLNVRMSADPELAEAWYLGDEVRVQQVLMNLLSNAVKFSNEGTVTVSVAKADEPGSLRFAVSDTGIGIGPEQRRHLFQRFNQVDNSRTRKYGGSGLGLAICKQLVSLMGGEIGVESELGRGSTFWFRLPLSPTEAPDGKREEVAPRRSDGSRAHSVLVVEDLELNREIAIAMLEHAGHRVEAVENGAEAVEAVRSGTYDIVLMDIQMPTMDGLTATRLIRAMDKEKGQVPIVAMTANVLADEVADFYATGMNGHIRKPIDHDEALAVIERCVRSGAQAADADPAAPTRLQA